MQGVNDAHTRPFQYVLVPVRQWDDYYVSTGVRRKLLHVQLFYTMVGPRVSKERADSLCPAGFKYVLHPQLKGRIPRGLAVTERRYRDQTRGVRGRRSQRETERTQSTVRKLALS